jgi:hypothetical protein
VKVAGAECGPERRSDAAVDGGGVARMEMGERREMLPTFPELFLSRR